MIAEKCVAISSTISILPNKLLDIIEQMFTIDLLTNLKDYIVLCFLFRFIRQALTYKRSDICILLLFITK